MPAQRFKLYKFHCEICGFTKTAENIDNSGLREFKRSEVPGASPKLNVETEKIDNNKNFKPARKFKCPKCGRLISAKVVTDEQALNAEKERVKKLMEEVHEKNIHARNKAGSERPEVPGQITPGFKT